MPYLRGTRLPLLSGGLAAAVAATWWDPDSEGLSVWAAYAAKGAADLTASYTDVSGEGHDAGVGVAPTWNSSDGWIFNGTTQYLTTTFVGETNQSQSMIVQFSNGASSAAGYLCGSTGPATSGSLPMFHILSSYTNGNHYYRNGAAAAGVAGSITSGNLAIAGTQGYHNGAADGGALGADGTTPWYAPYIGGQNKLSIGQDFYACYIQALAIYDTALTAGQVSAIATAMAAL